MPWHWRFLGLSLGAFAHIHFRSTVRSRRYYSSLRRSRSSGVSMGRASYYSSYSGWTYSRCARGCGAIGNNRHAHSRSHFTHLLCCYRHQSRGYQSPTYSRVVWWPRGSTGRCNYGYGYSWVRGYSRRQCYTVADARRSLYSNYTCHPEELAVSMRRSLLLVLPPLPPVWRMDHPFPHRPL